jgi:putative transposase
MRSLRILQEGATYHVTSKLDHDYPGLKKKQFKCLFLALVQKAKTKKGLEFTLWNFCIMDNHIHFLIKPEKGVSLSKCMQWLKCNFAKLWNKENNTKGHVWGERFFSRIIKDAEDFQNVSRYIDENPVRANIVKEASEWEFGGFFHRLKGITKIIDILLNPESLFTEHISPALTPG